MTFLKTPENAHMVIPLFEPSTISETQDSVDFCPKMAKNGLFLILYPFSGRAHTCNVADFFPLT